MGNATRVLFAALLITVITVLCRPVLSVQPERWFGFAVFVGSISVGTLVSRYYGQLDNAFVARVTGLGAHFLDSPAVGGRVTCFGDYFIWVIYSVMGAYIVAYIYVVASLPGRSIHEPSQVLPVFATGLALFALAFVTTRYAAYLRLITILDATCTHIEKGRKEAADFVSAASGRLGDIQEAVFRMEVLYEPPGNLFVTIGIMGTFLGLAFGLTTLPLDQMMAKHDLQTGIALAMPFVRSMGLALGISTTGVIAALAAHYWRSFGSPAIAAEDLMARARSLQN